MATLRCNAIKSGYVKQVSAGAVFPTAANTWYKVDGEEVTGNKRYLFIGFENNLNGIRHRPLQDAVFTGFVKLHNSGYGIYADACDSDFDPATLTYNNKPNRLDIGSGHLYGIAKGNVEERDFDFKNNGGSLYNLSRFAYAILKNRVIRLSGYNSTPREDDDYQSAQVVLSDGVSPPYLTITYDDTSFITSQIGLLTGLPATVNNGAPQTITWEDVFPELFYQGMSFELTATASSELPVEYTSSDVTIARIEGTTLYPLAAGTVTISALQNGNEFYFAADSVKKQLIVSPIPTTYGEYQAAFCDGDSVEFAGKWYFVATEDSVLVPVQAAYLPVKLINITILQGSSRPGPAVCGSMQSWTA